MKKSTQAAQAPKKTVVVNAATKKAVKAAEPAAAAATLPKTSANAAFMTTLGTTIDRVRITAAELKQIPTDLQETVVRVCSLLQSGKQVLIRTYFDMGNELQPVFAQQNTSGIAAVRDHLSRLLPGDAEAISQDTLYHALRFADRYSVDDVEKLLTSNLSWSHVRLLVNVQDKQARKTFEKAAVSEKLTTKDLEARITQWRNTTSLESARPGTGGRPVAVPTKPLKLFAKMREQSKRFSTVQTALFIAAEEHLNSLAATPVSEWPPAMVAELRTTLISAVALRDALIHQCDSVEQGLRQLEAMELEAPEVNDADLDDEATEDLDDDQISDEESDATVSIDDDQSSEIGEQQFDDMENDSGELDDPAVAAGGNAGIVPVARRTL